MRMRIRRLLAIGTLLAAVLTLGSCAVVLGFVVPNEFDFAGVSDSIDNVLIYDWGPGPDGGTYVGLVLLSGNYSWTADGYFTGSGNVIYVEVLADDPDLTIWQTYDWDDIGEVGELVYGSIWLGTEHDGTTNYFYDEYHEFTGGEALVRRPILGDMVITLDASTAGGSLEGQYRGESNDMMSGAFVPINTNPSVMSGMDQASQLPTLGLFEQE